MPGDGRGHSLSPEGRSDLQSDAGSPLARASWDRWSWDPARLSHVSRMVSVWRMCGTTSLTRRPYGPSPISNERLGAAEPREHGRLRSRCRHGPDRWAAMLNETPAFLDSLRSAPSY
jgi:hypothetical protein